MRQELPQDVVSAEYINLVRQQELFWLGVQDRLSSSDARVVDLRTNAQLPVPRIPGCFGAQ
jgi:hypothetical protein